MLERLNRAMAQLMEGCGPVLAISETPALDLLLAAALRIEGQENEKVPACAGTQTRTARSERP